MQRLLLSMNRLRMMMRSRLYILWFLFCMIPLLNGCSFWGFSGGGPMSKEEAYRIVGHAPSQMTESQKEVAMELYHKALKDPTFKNKDGVQVATTSFLPIFFTLGFYMPLKDVCVEKPWEPENSLFGSAQSVIPGYPLIWPWWSNWNKTYNLVTGEEISQRSLHGLGLGTFLGGYLREVSPEIKKKELYMVPSYYGDRYNVKTAYYLPLGICAVGRVNHRRYMQVLWIPIPLGAAND